MIAIDREPVARVPGPRDAADCPKRVGSGPYPYGVNLSGGMVHILRWIGAPGEDECWREIVALPRAVLGWVVANLETARAEPRGAGAELTRSVGRE